MVISVTSSGGTISGTVGTLINAVNIDDYGAAGDGTTDDTAALIAAIATGENVFIPKDKTYKIVGVNGNGVDEFASVIMNTGQMIIGEDRYTSKIKVTGNGRGIQLGKNCQVYNITFVGSGISSGLQYNSGLVPYETGIIIENCDFTDFSGIADANGGAGIFGLGNTGISPDFKDGYRVTNCDFYGNVCGMILRERSEFVTVQGGRFLRNTTGLLNCAGNNAFEGLNVMGNTTGIKLAAGANDGHGTFANCRVNHNTTNLSINGILLGITFTGSHFYAGNISIVSAVGVRFVGCDLVGAGTLTVTGSTVLIVGCRYPESPTSTALTLSTSTSTITESANLDF